MYFYNDDEVLWSPKYQGPYLVIATVPEEHSVILSQRIQSITPKDCPPRSIITSATFLKALYSHLQYKYVTLTPWIDKSIMQLHEYRLIQPAIPKGIVYVALCHP